MDTFAAPQQRAQHKEDNIYTAAIETTNLSCGLYAIMCNLTYAMIYVSTT